ncbi:hypothetical protein Tco_1321249 [Tanacetum coccineum]
MYLIWNSHGDDHVRVYEKDGKRCVVATVRTWDDSYYSTWYIGSKVLLQDSSMDMVTVTKIQGLIDVDALINGANRMLILLDNESWKVIQKWNYSKKRAPKARRGDTGFSSNHQKNSFSDKERKESENSVANGCSKRSSQTFSWHG